MNLLETIFSCGMIPINYTTAAVPVFTVLKEHVVQCDGVTLATNCQDGFISDFCDD